MPPRSVIGRRPSNKLAAERWIRRGDGGTADLDPATHEAAAARLTIDVTKELRARIKIAAFSRGSTVANLLREVLQREFGDSKDGA